MCRVSIETVIETRVKVWENEKCCGNTSRRRKFPQLFRVLPNFHECFYNSIGTRRTCFLFLSENTATKKEKNNNSLLRSSKSCKFSLFAPSLRQELVLVLCFLSSYTNTVLNQLECVLVLGYFLKTFNCIVFTNFQNTKIYSFQNLSLGFILEIFLKFRKFQPRYSYKVYSYKKNKSVS